MSCVLGPEACPRGSGTRGDRHMLFTQPRKAPSHNANEIKSGKKMGGKKMAGNLFPVQ